MSCSFYSMEKILNTLGWKKEAQSIGNTHTHTHTTSKGGKVKILGMNSFSEAGIENQVSQGSGERKR